MLFTVYTLKFILLYHKVYAYRWAAAAYADDSVVLRRYNSEDISSCGTASTVSLQFINSFRVTIYAQHF